ncbi:MAG: ABC transporter substrate-binding protein [Deltaproteobacteria bacterium]|nr:ABC transporter substrate-binding protein [Deltaproteobacteria bacterium]
MKLTATPLRVSFLALVCALAGLSPGSPAQERVRLSYSSTDATNGIWTVGKDLGFYKKHGLDADLVYIGSTTIGVAAILAGDIDVGNAAGSGVALAASRGADLVSTGCFVNTLAYELVVLESVKSPEDLKGKSIGISRFGSVSDVAAREMLKGVGLKPVEDVNILQVGGASDRAAAFSRGAIAGFPSPPGNVRLTGKLVPYRILVNMADLEKPYPLPFICAVTKKSYLAKKRDTVKRVIMALVEAGHYFKTNKEGAQRVVAKYLRVANKAYLEDSYRSTAKLIDRVPYTTREGMKIQLDDALKKNPESRLTIDDLIDDSIVRELEKEGFIDRVYGTKG